MGIGLAGGTTLGCCQKVVCLALLPKKWKILDRLYGDPAYPISNYIEGPFRESAVGLTDVEKLFNEDMSSVRIAVEWGFGEVVQQFAFLDFYKNLKIGLQPVGTLCTVGTLLTNCRVCLGHGGKVADFCGIPPPGLEMYLSNRLA